MSIQWYPGHMHKAQLEIKKALPKIDLIIEIIDARIPYSSSNPQIEQFSSYKDLSKPVIKVLNKADLADPAITKLWQNYFNNIHDTKALAITGHHREQVLRINQLCLELGEHRRAKQLPVRAMIMGIPNVGKSTIINCLTGRTIAKVGNEPAVTKAQQRIDLENGICLFDTPGILWPKIHNENSSYRLAITGAIKDTALDYDEIAFYAIDYLKEHYQDNLINTFQFDKLPNSTIDIIDAIAFKRGCLRKGGQVDLDNVSKVIIKEIRTLALGPLSFETPKMMQTEILEVEKQIREKEEKKAARKKAFKKKKR